MNYSDGEIYEGEWIDDLIKGKGIYSFKNRDKLDGVFLNGKEHIKGKYFRNDGFVFEGEFINNILNGYGKLCKNETLLY
jgi:hypothetical protein